jgi:ArsR family transcriptional regulator
MGNDDLCQGEHTAPPDFAKYSDRSLKQAAGLFKALADVPRLRILEMLAQRPCCVSDLAAASGDEISTVSQRLRVLRSERLVMRQREGKHMIYQLADNHVFELVTNALEHADE